MKLICPPRTKLTAFLAEAGVISPDWSDHLDDCPHCQDELDRYADTDLAMIGLGDKTNLNNDLEPALRRMMDHLIDEVSDATIDFVPQLEPIADRPELVGRFDRFEVVRELGRGGMGVVYEAFDPVLRRTIALKILRPELAHQDKAHSRFLREARATADLCHEHVLSPHSIEEYDGVPYLVFPLVRGQNLQQWIDAEGSLPMNEALRIAAEIADGLSAAHAKGLVHRDMKPSNVLLEGSQKRVKLADFGLVRMDDEFDLSHDGALCGTPRYMAPEQAQGLPCTAVTDLFGLGSIVHFMLTGRPPFNEASTYGILRSVVEDHIAPPADSPAAVMKLLQRLHAKAPSARPNSAAEVAIELRSLSERRVVSTVRNSPTGTLIMISTILLLGVGFFAAASQVQQPVQPPPPKVPVVAFEALPSHVKPHAATPMANPPVAPVLFVGHTGSANRVAVTPDGRSAISVSGYWGDKTIRVWDFASGKEVRQFKLESPYPATDIPSDAGVESSQWTALGISSDGKLVATGSMGGLAVIWDFETGKEKHRLMIPSTVKQLVFSPDDTTLLAATGDGSLYLYDPATGKLRKSWLAHTQEIRAIGFLPGGDRILSVSYDRLVKAWDVKTGEELYRCEGHAVRAQGLAISSDGKWFISGAGNMHKWDAQTGKLLKNYAVPSEHVVTSVKLSPDNSTIASVGYDGTLRIWDVQSGRELYRFSDLVGWIWDVAFAPDGQNVICTSGGNSGDWLRTFVVADFALRRWKIPGSGSEPADVCSDDVGPVSDLAVTPDGNSLVEPQHSCQTRNKGRVVESHEWASPKGIQGR